MGILIKWGFVTGILLLAVTTDTISQNQSNFKADQEVESYVKDTVVLRIQEYVGEFIQWQKSPDMVVWLDIPNANADTLEIVSDGISSNYYRSKVFAGTCNPFMSSVVAVRFFDLSQLETNPITSIQAISAISGGQIISDGGTSITSRGIVWSVSNNPTLENNNGFTVDGSGVANWESELVELNPNKTYFVRAYATNSVGTSYGQEETFTTPDGLVTLSTSDITATTATTATSGGDITDDGGAPVTARGLVWGISTNPTISSNSGYTVNGSGTGSWESEMSGLNPGSTYYVRSYATNSIGTFYGDEKNFTTHAALPQVTTTQVSSITATTAISGGEVTDDGGATVTARGIVWSTSENPTLDDNDGYTDDGTGTGTWVSNLTELSPNTTYYVRAYATNIAGTQYGNQQSFTTLATLPQVTTTEVSSITATTADSGGEVTDDGGATVTARGVCWSTSQNPTINDSYTVDGTGTGSYVSSVTGLIPNTSYYLRAYATNSVGTAYGSQQSFTTGVTAPSITTSTVTSITSNSATSGGNVTSSGGASVTARGVVWSTSQNPTTTSNEGITTNEAGTGSFTSNLTNLEANTTYYLRAYATNSVGTNYGNSIIFITAPGNIGDNYGGGVIAYFFQLNDPGYVEGEFHGLIAAPSDQSTGAKWGCYGTNIGGTFTALGAGMSNTLAIVNGCSEADIAGRICNSLVLNGYSDWYLPSLIELNNLFINREAIGGFANDYYWSSSQYGSDYARVKNFSDGSTANSTKNFFRRVRAVRTF